MKQGIRKGIYIFLAFFFLGLGVVGALLPIMPTTPFLLLSASFFARGSKGFNSWFTSTKLYKGQIENFIKSGSMSYRGKVKILALVTGMLAVALYLTHNTCVRIVIVSVLAIKYYYFIFKIKSSRVEDARDYKSKGE